MATREVSLEKKVGMTNMQVNLSRNTARMMTCELTRLVGSVLMG